LENDNVMIQLLARLGVDYTPALANMKFYEQALARHSETVAGQFAKMEKQMLTTGKNLYAGETLRTALERERVIYDQHGRELLRVQDGISKQMTTASKTAAETISRTGMTINDSFGNVENRALQHKNFVEKTFSSGYFAHHLNWLATATAIGAILYPLHEAKKVAMDLTASMTKLKQVLEIVPPYDKSPEKLTKDLEELKEVAGVMAVAYGVEFSRVIDVMSQAGRRFKDVASIISATDTALQLTVVDMVPLETAIGSVEAIMSQFGLTTGQAKQALFEISAASHMLQINATDLLEAIKRSGSAFKTMKADTRETVAAISVLAQMTAQKGGMIGNAWKSLEASFASEKGQKALRELGIELFDSNGQLENMSELILRLQEKWQTLSDRAKMHYATVLAGGKFHYQRLEAFLSDYTGAYKKALAGIETANADMQKKLIESTMTSLPQQFRMTEASIQVLAESLLRDLTPAMIIFMANLRENVNSLKENRDSIAILMSTGMRLAEAYIIWKVGVAAYAATVSSATVQTTLMQGSLLKLELTARGVPATLATVAGTIGSVGAAAASTVARIGALVAVMGVFNRIAGSMYDEKAQRIKDLGMELRDAEAILNYSVKNTVKTAGQLLWEGHPQKAINQLVNIPFGGLHLEDKIYKEKREKILEDLRVAREDKRKADEEALTRDLKNLDDIMAKYEKEANARTSEMLEKLKNEMPTFDFTNPDNTKGAQTALDFLKKQEHQLGLTAQQALLLGTQYQILTAQQYGAIPTLTESINQYQNLQAQIANTKDQMAQMEAENVSLEEKIASTGDETGELTQKLYDNRNALEQHKLSIIEDEKAMRGMITTLIRSSREIARDNALTALENTQKSAIRNMEAARDKELEYLKNLKESYQQASDIRIKAIQDEIDALELQNNLLEEQEELSDREKAVAEAKTKIATIEANKNIRRINPNTGQWEWVADELALREAKQDLEDAEKELTKTQTDIRKAARRRDLENQLEHEKDIQKTQIDSYDKQIETARRKWESRLQVERDMQASEKSIHEQHWKTMLDSEQINIDAMNDILKLGLDGALKKWQDYYKSVKDTQPVEIPESLKVGGKLEELLIKWYKGDLTQEENLELNQLAGQYAASTGSRPWEGVTPVKDWKTGQTTTPTEPTQPPAQQKDPSQMTWQELLQWYPTHTSSAMAEIARAGQVYAQKWEAGDVEGARAAHKWADQIRKAIGQPMVWDENTESSPSVHNSYQKGGPILYDQLAQVHKKEWVLDAKTVSALGGFSGVERLVARVNAPDLTSSLSGFSGVNTNTVNNNYSNDHRVVNRNVNLLAPIHMNHIRDAGAFIRELQRLAYM